MATDDWAALATAEGGWGIQRTEQFLKRLKQLEPKFIQGGSTLHNLLRAGEFKLTPSGNMRHVLDSQAAGAPVDWVRVNPILVTGSSYILLAKSPHPNAAKLMLEWCLSPQGLVIVSKELSNYIPGVPSPYTELFKGLQLAVRTDESIAKFVELKLMEKFSEMLYGVK